MNTSFFGELLQTISDRGRNLLKRERRGQDPVRSEGLLELCEDLLSGRGEASGVALAREILSRYAELRTGPRVAFFEVLAQRFGTDHERRGGGIAFWRDNPNDTTAAEVHAASEPRRQELFRRLNLAPGGTAALVRMREQLLDVLPRREDLRPLDDDFVHLFSSWFNRGFLVLRRIDWSTPAIVLEKIIRYEAVHAIRDWEDLRRRIDPPDRRCYAFFHPALVDDPLIFVEVALTRELPGAIAPILAPDRENGERERAAKNSTVLSEEDKAALALMDAPDWWRNEEIAEQVRDPVMHAAAWYFLRAKNGRTMPVDSVARFHLGNGARLERIDFLGDTSERAGKQAHGLMVNYLYDLDDIEKNHEAFAENRTVVVSSAVQRLVRTVELVPSAG